MLYMCCASVMPASRAPPAGYGDALPTSCLMHSLMTTHHIGWHAVLTGGRRSRLGGMLRSLRASRRAKHQRVHNRRFNNALDWH